MRIVALLEPHQKGSCAVVCLWVPNVDDPVVRLERRCPGHPDYAFEVVTDQRPVDGLGFRARACLVRVCARPSGHPTRVSTPEDWSVPSVPVVVTQRIFFLAEAITGSMLEMPWEIIYANIVTGVGIYIALRL